MRRFAGFAFSVVGISLLCGATPARADVPADGRSPALCGLKDTPETGLQGDVPLADQQSGRAQQGYNCGLAVVGYSNLGGVSGTDVTGIDHCAYVRVPGAGGGIRVVDVSVPTAPVVVQTLPLTVTSENIYARKSPDRSLLVAGGAPSAAGQPHSGVRVGRAGLHQSRAARHGRVPGIGPR